MLLPRVLGLALSLALIGSAIDTAPFQAHASKHGSPSKPGTSSGKKPKPPALKPRPPSKSSNSSVGSTGSVSVVLKRAPMDDNRSSNSDANNAGEILQKGISRRPGAQDFSRPADASTSDQPTRRGGGNYTNAVRQAFGEPSSSNAARTSRPVSLSPPKERRGRSTKKTSRSHKRPPNTDS